MVLRLARTRLCWSKSTLQEAIDGGFLREWPPTKLMTLFTMLLTGLKTLHRTVLHGDLRPANVMCLGEQIDEPSRYVLIDFGRFVNAAERVDMQPPRTDNTVLAARMGPK